MAIQLKRSYDPAASDDGYRVLVDGLWPRGQSKSELKIDEWLKDIAPSKRLREQFHNDRMGWQDFRNAYLRELTEHKDALKALETRAQSKNLTLVFSAKDTQHNNAEVVRQYLRMLRAHQ